MDQIVSDLPRELPDNFGSTQTDFLGTNDPYLGVKNFQDQKTPEIPKKSPFVSPQYKGLIIRRS